MPTAQDDRDGNARLAESKTGDAHPGETSNDSDSHPAVRRHIALQQLVVAHVLITEVELNLLT